MLQVVLVRHNIRERASWKSFYRVFIIYGFKIFCKHLCLSYLELVVIFNFVDFSLIEF